MMSPSHCWSAPWTRNWVVAVSSSLSGAKTSCSRPLPKSGRVTPPPGGGEKPRPGKARGEDELQQAAAEVGAVHPLAGRGEQHLLDQVADVVVVAGLAGAAAVVGVEREVDVHGPVTSR